MRGHFCKRETAARWCRIFWYMTTTRFFSNKSITRAQTFNYQKYSINIKPRQQTRKNKKKECAQLTGMRRKTQRFHHTDTKDGSLLYCIMKLLS